MTPQLCRNGGIQSEWKPPLSVFGPHTKASSSHGGVSDSCRLDILSHIRIPYIQVFLPALCFFISHSLTLSHTSTDPQVMTFHLDNKKIEGERER